jgi:hypothetical protein
MSTSPTEARSAIAQRVTVTDDAVIVDLVDGRTVTVPLSWYPRLGHGTPAERAKWRLIGRGEGIHWPDLDEDISVAGLLAGHASNETQGYLRRWLQRARRPVDDAAGVLLLGRLSDFRGDCRIP